MSAASTPPSDSAELVHALKASPLFRGFTETGLQIIASIAHTKSVPPGTPLFVEQMIGESLYVIAQGQVRLAVRGPNGDEVNLTTVSEPESIGEAALLRPGPRQCSAYAVSSTTVIEISRRDVGLLQRTKPQACLKLMMGVVELVGARLRETEGDLRAFLAWRSDQA